MGLPLKCSKTVILIVVCSVGCLSSTIYQATSLSIWMSKTLKFQSDKSPMQRSESRCAINLYGLPRSFKVLVLPSLVKNVILPNAKYNCDYFVHFYNVTFEQKGRSGNGGEIRPSDIFYIRAPILEAAAMMNSTRIPTIAFGSHTDEEFWNQRNDTIQKVRHTRDSDGNLLYFPWKEKSLRYPETTDNIIKMWHSIDAAWSLMKENELAAVRQKTTTTAGSSGARIRYDRVAMLRSDVVYTNDVDIYNKANGERDNNNTVAVIPAFGGWCNDRLIYGPVDAVRVWATERFARMDDYANRTYYERRGWSMQSELFVCRLVSVMEENNFTVENHTTLCFLRARADGTIWYRDCGDTEKTFRSRLKTVLESTLNRSCHAVSGRAIKCE